MARLGGSQRAAPNPRWPIRFLIGGLVLASIGFAAWLFASHMEQYKRDRAGREAKALIEGLLIYQAASWNEGDLDGFMAGYWDSPDLEFVSDTTTHGFQPVKEHYFKRYKADGKEMWTLMFTDIDVIVSGKMEADATGKWKVATSKGTTGGGFAVHLRKFGDGWKIVRDTTTSDKP